MFDSVINDLRCAVRSLRQSATFTLVAVGTLALGTGAAVAIFTIVNAVLLRPLPIVDPDRVVVISSRYQTRADIIAASWTKFQALCRARVSGEAHSARPDLR